MLILAACIVGVVAAVVFYLRKIYSVFSEYEIKNIVALPSVGNMASEQCLVLEHLVDTKLCKKYPEKRFIGRFEYINIDRESLISFYRSYIFIFCTLELKKQVYRNPKILLCTSRDSGVSGFCEIFMYFHYYLLLFQIAMWDSVSNNRQEFFRNIEMVLDIINTQQLKPMFRTNTICFFIDLENASILIYLLTDYDIISGTNLKGFGAGYELTVHSDVQDRIGNGVRRPDTINNFKLDCDTLCNVTFETATFRNSSLDARIYYVLVYL